MHFEGSSIVYLAIYLLTTIVAAVYFVTRLEASTESNREFFTNEVQHLKDIIEIKISEVKKDIGRLERKQEESNQIKERLVIQEQSNKSLHKRMDEHLGKEEI